MKKIYNGLPYDNTKSDKPKFSELYGILGGFSAYLDGIKRDGKISDFQYETLKNLHVKEIGAWQEKYEATHEMSLIGHCTYLRNVDKCPDEKCRFLGGEGYCSTVICNNNQATQNLLEADHD